MIEILTIVKTVDEKGQINFVCNGLLPLDEAARALVITAYQAEPLKRDGDKTNH